MIYKSTQAGKSQCLQQETVYKKMHSWLQDDCSLPKAANGIGEHRLPLYVARLRVLAGLSLPARVWNDHFIGEGM